MRAIKCRRIHPSPAHLISLPEFTPLHSRMERTPRIPLNPERNRVGGLTGATRTVRSPPLHRCPATARRATYLFQQLPSRNISRPSVLEVCWGFTASVDSKIESSSSRARAQCAG
ncbi:Uncharacterized protein DAT39_005586, partial [Clarias magur]